MKKFFAMLLSLAMMTGMLTGCSNDSGKDQNDGPVTIMLECKDGKIL